MEYKVIKGIESYITLGELKKDIEEIGAQEVRNKCLVKKEDRTYRIVLDGNNYYYYLLNLNDFSLVSGITFRGFFSQTIEKLLTNGYEVIYEK